MKAMSCFDILPDAVLCLIFSRLEHAQTVANCSTVCRRWRALCQTVDTLTFESFKLFGQTADKNRKASSIEAIVSGMLFNTHGVKNLNISYHPVVWPWLPNDFFSETIVCQWLEHVRSSLEALTLVDPNLTRPQPQRLLHLSECRKLQQLSLCYGAISEVPVGCHSFERLTTCLLELIVISDYALEQFVELCPSLQVLKLNSCKGLVSPVLNAPSMTRLMFVSELDRYVVAIERLTINAPKLSTVSLSYVEELVTEGRELVELVFFCHVKPQLSALPLLDILSINGHIWNLDSISELVRLGSHLKYLHINAIMKEKIPLQLDSFLRHLLELETLHIGSDLFECLQAGAKIMPLSQSFSLPRLKEVTAVVICGNEHWTSVLGVLLRCSPCLKTLNINVETLEVRVESNLFFNQVLALQRSYPHVIINMDWS